MEKARVDEGEIDVLVAECTAVTRFDARQSSKRQSGLAHEHA